MAHKTVYVLCYFPTCIFLLPTQFFCFFTPIALFSFDASNLFILYDSKLEAMNGNSKKTKFRQIVLKAIEWSERPKYGTSMLE